MRHRSPKPHYPLAAIFLPLSLPAYTPHLPSILETPLSSRSFDHPQVLFKPPVALKQGQRARSLLRRHVLERDSSPNRGWMYSVKTYGLENGQFGVRTRRGLLLKQPENRVNRRELDSKSPLSDRRARLTPGQAQGESVGCFQTRDGTIDRCSAFYIQERMSRQRESSKDQSPVPSLPVLYRKLQLSDSAEREAVFRPPILH